MKIFWSIIFFTSFLANKGIAQELTKAVVTDTTKKDSSYHSSSSLYLGIGQDSFFGYYVSASGAYGINSKTNFTFYSNYWANPAFGDMVSGKDFWTEVGVGISRTFNNGFTLNPSVGFTYGKVLSGGPIGVLGDGITPALFIYYNKGKFDGNAGVVWFKHFRKEGPVTIDFLWHWIELGRKLSPRITAGAHYEHFYLSHMSQTNPQTLYLWLGPYLQYNFNNGCFIKQSAGYDRYSKGYVKISLNIPLVLN